MKKDARVQARKLIEQANTEAGRIISEAEAKAKDCFAALVADGQEKAQSEYDEAIAQAGKACEQMAAEAGNKQDQIVKFISERIVMSSVNN